MAALNTVTYQGITHECNDPNCHVVTFMATLDKHSRPTCEHCGNDDASLLLALCSDCAEALP